MIVEEPGARTQKVAERMKVFAHRGASEDVPEHTLAAYTQAILDGADGLEHGHGAGEPRNAGARDDDADDEASNQRDGDSPDVS